MIFVNFNFLVYESTNFWAIIDCEIKCVSIAKANLAHKLDLNFMSSNLLILIRTEYYLICLLIKVYESCNLRFYF
jgi:hypothetical protein